jgi:hypothetical protein
MDVLEPLPERRDRVTEVQLVGRWFAREVVRRAPRQARGRCRLQSGFRAGFGRYEWMLVVQAVAGLGAGAADGMPGGPYELVVRPQDLDDARSILRERSDTGEQ